jgi:FtsP/CotA-like multicopper oxidase with cupredoxin domain
MTPPWRQDGVPGISGPPIAGGQSADYDFPLTSGGTYWMILIRAFRSSS